jgi:hypothetical protein
MTRLLAVIALGTGIALGTLLLGSQVHAQAYNDWWETCWFCCQLFPEEPDCY